MHAVLLKTSFVVVFQCTRTLWCHLNILFFGLLTFLMYLFQFLLSYSSKQLSTFHLPFGGDENVLAKDLAPWPKVWNPRFLSSYRLVFVFFRNFLKINILGIHYLTLLLQSTSNVNAPLLASTPHRPWACRGMPFDDVCQMPSATQSFPARWPCLFDVLLHWGVGRAPRRPRRIGCSPKRAEFYEIS